jgi:predicted transcriptional regulator
VTLHSALFFLYEIKTSDLSVLLSELVPNIIDDISQCITYNTTGIQSIYNIELKIKLGIIYTVCLS